jgi:tryptophanyl-tRNA synthetase
MGYGEAKTALLEKIESYFAPYRAKREELLKTPEKVEEALVAGAARARTVARATLAHARKACGID